MGLGLQGLDKLWGPTGDVSAVSKLSCNRNFKKRGERKRGWRREGGEEEGRGKEVGKGRRGRGRERGTVTGWGSRMDLRGHCGVPSAGGVQPGVCTGGTSGAWVPSILHPTQASL